LPSLDSPYDFHRLSQAETEALEEAFSDGFGQVTTKGARPQALPSGINTGLLKHAFHHKSWLEDADDDDPDDAFWETDSEEGLAPSDKLPINFIQRRLRMYFRNQLNRFCHRVISEDPLLANWERCNVEDLALDRLYEKPWYEVHAIQLFENMDELLKAGARRKSIAAPGLAFLVSCFAGELGRLIEQYYWRLRYEKAAITGLATRKGASAGGASKATLHQAQHLEWQNAASQVWERRSGLTKTAVSKIIRNQLGVPRTAKHIARYISRPK
jgi:hypothetical protein